MIKNTIDVRVRFCETDAIGIVHHSAFVPWLEMARLELIRAHGLPYKALNEIGIHMPVMELNIQFKNSLVFDDVVSIHTSITETPKMRVFINYELTRGDDKIASAKSTQTFISGAGNPVRPPQLFKDLVNKHF